jgi:GNAT superfamily N-acetyltransferase
MKKPEFSFIDRLNEHHKAGLIRLVKSMYNYMERHGLMLILADEGAEKWLTSVSNTLGKYGMIVIAEDKDEIIGFAHGALKFLPDYLGNSKVGVLTHIYIEDKSRGAGTGKKLTEMLEDWFKSQHVDSVELQVISGNADAIKYWVKMGYDEELIQFRKRLSSGSHE